jgi:hypothetical protein
MESRKLLLENTFAVKEVFSNNEATSWVVEELKRRGLKRLFKPVASTAYERLVKEFYTHLRIDGDQPDSLFSSIDGREVEVTDRTKFRYSQENEPLGRIALRKYRDRTTENGVL